MDVIKHIFVPLDGSSAAEGVLPHVRVIAMAFNSQVTLLNVLERDSSLTGRPIEPLEWQFRKTEAQTYIGNLCAQLAARQVSVSGLVLEGPAADRIIEDAIAKQVDLIILSSHGQSAGSNWNVSNVVQKVLARALVPVMIVRGQAAAESIDGFRYRRVLVALDTSSRSEWVLPLAITLAKQHEAQLILAHVVNQPEMPHYLPPTPEDIELSRQVAERNRMVAARYLGDLQARLPVACETRLLVSGQVAEALHTLVSEEKIDLVVLSAHGYSAAHHRPYGSVTLNFVAYGTTPLLIIQDLAPDEVDALRAKPETHPARETI